MIEIDRLLPAKTAKFVKSQIKLNLKKSKHAYRWGLDDKLFALSIFYHSRRSYYILRQLFALPSKRTLLRTLQRTNIVPGFNSQIFDALKVRVDTFDEKDRQCVIVFDEMSLKSYVEYNPQGDFIEGLENFGGTNQTKKVANHALAFMVRGLASKWKQPLCYFLTSGPVSAQDLQSLVKSCVEKLPGIGLSVKAMICDQGSNNRSFVETLEKVSLAKPYIIYGDEKVFVFYDPPHLLKNIRNNFMKHGFLYNGVPIQWQYIVQFYTFDKANNIRMAPKLSEKHVTLPPFTAMRVNLAAQVMSHSVAAGLSTLSHANKLPADAEHTAQFIENFDQLFNAFNSGSLKSHQKMRHALSEKSGHKDFLEKKSFIFEPSHPK